MSPSHAKVRPGGFRGATGEVVRRVGRSAKFVLIVGMVSVVVTMFGTSLIAGIYIAYIDKPTTAALATQAAFFAVAKCCLMLLLATVVYGAIREGVDGLRKEIHANRSPWIPYGPSNQKGEGN